jgi:hypothetical protein
MTADELARLNLPDDIRALGEPELVFRSANKEESFPQWAKYAVSITLILGSLAFIGLVLAAAATVPHVRQRTGVLAAMIGVPALAAAFGVFLLRFAMNGAGGALFLIYKDGLAFHRGMGWRTVGWAEVERYDPNGNMSYPILVLWDGSSVFLYDTEGRASSEVLQEIRYRVAQYHRDNPEAVAEARAAVAAAKVAEAEAEAEAEKPSPVGQLIGGLVLLGLAVVFFYYLDQAEAKGGSVKMNVFVALAYKVGGKWVAAGLVAAVGVGVLANGLRAALAEGGEKARVNSRG